MDCGAYPPHSLDRLYRAFDGPVPVGMLQYALNGQSRETAIQWAALSLHQRLAAEARLGAARRRAMLPACTCSRDVWLNRLAATLAHHRHAAASLAGQSAVQRKANSQ